MAVQEKRAFFAVGIPIGEFPDTMFQNLMSLIAARANLLKKALGTETLVIVYLRGKLWFPWFTIRESHREAIIYRHFVYFLCEAARFQSSFSTLIHYAGTSKLAMRLFLLELGYVGRDLKEGRKLLLRNFRWFPLI